MSPSFYGPPGNFTSELDGPGNDLALREPQLELLLNHFGQMQQQMMDQFQQSMMMMLQMFGGMHRDQMGLIKEEARPAPRAERRGRRTQGRDDPALASGLRPGPGSGPVPAPAPAPAGPVSDRRPVPPVSPAPVTSVPPVPPVPPPKPAAPHPVATPGIAAASASVAASDGTGAAARGRPRRGAPAAAGWPSDRHGSRRPQVAQRSARRHHRRAADALAEDHEHAAGRTLTRPGLRRPGPLPRRRTAGSGRRSPSGTPPGGATRPRPCRRPARAGRGAPGP